MRGSCGEWDEAADGPEVVVGSSGILGEPEGELCVVGSLRDGLRAGRGSVSVSAVWRHGRNVWTGRRTAANWWM